MRTLHWLGAALTVATAIVVGCGSNNGTCNTQYLAPQRGAGVADMCASAGGTCSYAGGGISSCGPNMHPALSGSPEATSCSNNYYSDPANNNCGALNSNAGLQPAAGTCCLPDGDAGDDASADASDDGGDSGPQIGSCAGTPCDPGCACGLLPGPNTPTCFCEGADAGADAATPSCGSIYCFAGCSCADESTSTCSCP